MTRIKRGVSRTVLLVGSFAIKFPSFRNGTLYFLYGMLGNMLEAEKWTLSKSLFLAPVYFCAPFGLFTVNKRYYNLLNRVLTREEVDSLPLINYDNNGDNAALDGDQVVILDYGNTGLYLIVQETEEK